MTDNNLWLPLSEVKAQASAVLSKIANSGARGELIIDHSRTHALKAKKGALEENKATDLVTVGVRVIKHQRVGLAYSQATDAQALADMVDQALVNASFSGADPSEQIGEHSALINADNQACPEEAMPAPEHPAQTLFALEQHLLDTPSIESVPYNGFSQTYHETLIFNTQGVFAHHQARKYMLYAYALAQRGSGEQKKQAMAGDLVVARCFDEINYQALTKKIAQQTLDFLEGEPVATGHWDVIFSTDALAQILGVFALVFSGKSAKDGINPWRDQLNQEVADERFNLTDEPLNIQGLGFTPFDSEGVPTQSTTLIEQGRLCRFLHNHTSARYFETQNTAHAKRSPKSPLDAGAHQLFVHPDPAADQADLTGGRYLKLTDLSGLHSGANPISGEFSFGASGYRYEAGKVCQVVREITVAGNFFKLLKQIRSIGAEVEFNSTKTYCMPLIRFKDLSISGV